MALQRQKPLYMAMQIIITEYAKDYYTVEPNLTAMRESKDSHV